MIAFLIDDMTCGHCARTITQAVAGVDPGARVEVRLGEHLVQIEAGAADAGTLRAAIEAAGYTPVPAPRA